MNRTSNENIIGKLWFGLLILYVVTSHLAQDLLLPSAINSLALYAFLAYSLFAIVCYGKIKLTPILWWELACLVFSLIAMLYSPSFSIMGGAYYSLIVNFIIVFFFTQMPWNRGRFDMIMRTFAYSSPVLIVALALTGNLKDNSDSGRLGEELTGNANILGAMFMLSAFCALWLLISSNKKSTKFFSVVSLLIIYFGMFLSGGRKYLILPIIFAYILLLNKTDENKRNHIIKNTIITAVIVLALYFLIMKIPFFYNAIGYRFEGFFNLFNESQDADSSTLVRKKMIDACIEKWPESPIWGHGFDSFKYYNATSVTGHKYYSHNNFLELLYNEGIIGFVVYYSFYSYLFFKALKYKGDSLRKGFVLATILTSLVFEVVEVTYSISPTQFMLCFCLIVLGPMLDEKNTDEICDQRN